MAVTADWACEGIFPSVESIDAWVGCLLIELFGHTNKPGCFPWMELSADKKEIKRRVRECRELPPELGFAKILGAGIHKHSYRAAMHCPTPTSPLPSALCGISSTDFITGENFYAGLPPLAKEIPINDSVVCAKGAVHEFYDHSSAYRDQLRK